MLVAESEPHVKVNWVLEEFAFLVDGAIGTFEFS